VTELTLGAEKESPGTGLSVAGEEGRERGDAAQSFQPLRTFQAPGYRRVTMKAEDGLHFAVERWASDESIWRK
jgi:hypothetical protein